MKPTRTRLGYFALGWSNAEVAGAVRRSLGGWHDLLRAVAKEATDRFGGLGPLRPDDVASLIGSAFLGAEARLLLGFEEK